MFGKSKKPAAINHVAAFDQELAAAVAKADKAGVGAGSLRDKLEAAAEALQWRAHVAAEQRRMSTPVAVAVNERWAKQELERLAREQS
jgi:hypothetical protein